MIGHTLTSYSYIRIRSTGISLMARRSILDLKQVQISHYLRYFLFYPLLSFILLDLFISLDCFEINSPNVRNGQIFSIFKCQPNDVVMCALDLPNQTISFVTREYCLSTCHTGFRWSWFNYIADEDPTRCMMGECQLYAKQPQNVSQKARCSLYKNDAISLGKEIEAICNGFQYLPSVNKFYKPIFQQTFWGQATQICSSFSSSSHLVIFNSLYEFQQLVNYLIQLSDNSSLNCMTHQWNGYWTAKRRTDVYTKDQATCLSSPFVWIKDNTTSGSLPEQSWETDMWVPGQPNCYQSWPSPGMSETCVLMASGYEYNLNDMDCWYPQCPVCQIDLN